MAAIRESLRSPATRTPDLGGTADTATVTHTVIAGVRG
jgi:isocitrate/isopropylmalate dehydrogenase